MAQKFLTSINLSSNELQNALLHPLATAPAIGPAGKVYYNTSENVLYVSDGTIWRNVSGDVTAVLAGAGIAVTGTTGDVTVALTTTGVSAGSYGSASSIPTFTVDAYGRLTAAGSASISTVLAIAGDTGTDDITLGTDTLTFEGGDGITSTVTNNNVAIQVDSTVVRTSGDQTIGGNKTFSNNVIISGDLTVNGSTTTVNTENILLADNIISLNSNFTTGAPTQDAGIEVLRGDEATMSLFWDESEGDWYATDVAGVPKRIINEGTLAETATANGYATTITGNSTDASFTLAFPGAWGIFMYSDVIVQLVDSTTSETVFADVTRSSSGITVVFATAPATGQNYRVLMTKVG